VSLVEMITDVGIVERAKRRLDGARPLDRAGRVAHPRTSGSAHLGPTMVVELLLVLRVLASCSTFARCDCVFMRCVRHVRQNDDYWEQGLCKLAPLTATISKVSATH